MMRRSHAFTLINLLVSLSLSTILGLTAFYTLNRIQIHIFDQKRYCYQTLNDILMLDVIKRDIEHAHFYQEGLKLSDNSMQILTILSQSKQNNSKKMQVQWKPSIGGFNRIKGQYDFIHQQWSKKRTTFFESTIQIIYFQLIIEESSIKSLVLHIKHQSKTVEKIRFNLLNQQVLLP